MSSPHNDQDMRVVSALLVVTVLLSVGLALGMGIQTVRRGVAPTGAMGVPPVVAAATVPLARTDDASVVVDNGVVKFYFASGNAELASGALEALGDAIAAAQAGKRLVLSGFHDVTGDPALNAELARQRAFSVRDVLLNAGVAEASLELKKPEKMPDSSGSHAEARRVEVVITE